MIRPSLLPLLALSAVILVACGTSRGYDPRVAVTVAVDFGPSGHAPHSDQLLVKEGSSPIDALAEAVPVVRGFVSSTKNDVWAVDGVATDKSGGHYWLWQLNGRLASLAPDRYQLRNGDHVTWLYARSDPPEYRRH